MMRSGNSSAAGTKCKSSTGNRRRRTASCAFRSGAAAIPAGRATAQPGCSPHRRVDIADIHPAHGLDAVARHFGGEIIDVDDLPAVRIAPADADADRVHGRTGCRSAGDGLVQVQRALVDLRLSSWPRWRSSSSLVLLAHRRSSDAEGTQSLALASRSTTMPVVFQPHPSRHADHRRDTRNRTSRAVRLQAGGMGRSETGPVVGMQAAIRQEDPAPRWHCHAEQGQQCIVEMQRTIAQVDLHSPRVPPCKAVCSRLSTNRFTDNRVTSVAGRFQRAGD